MATIAIVVDVEVEPSRVDEFLVVTHTLAILPIHFSAPSLPHFSPIFIERMPAFHHVLLRSPLRWDQCHRIQMSVLRYTQLPPRHTYVIVLLLPPPSPLLTLPMIFAQQKVMQQDAEGSRTEPGCIRFDVLRDISQSNRFFFYEVRPHSHQHSHFHSLCMRSCGLACWLVGIGILQ